MRAKYKVGQFIQTKEGDNGEVPATGVIEAVVIRADGVSYQLPNLETEVAEDQVAAVFRPVTPRKPKAAGEKKASKKAAKAA